VINPLSGNLTSSSLDHLLEEFADELAFITFPPGNDDLPFNIESDLRELEYLLNHDPTKEIDSILKDSINECSLADPNDNLFDTIPEMFTDEHTLDYTSPSLYDDFDDDLFEFDFDNDDPFDSKEYKIKELFSCNPTSSSHTDLTLPEVINPLSGNLTSSSLDHLLEEFADELAFITFPPGNDDLPFNIESDLRELEYLLNHDPTKEIDSILKDSINECSLADPNDNLFDTIPEMFTDEHTLDYTSPSLYDDFDDDLFEFDFDNDDPFDSKEYKIKESKLLIDELDPPRSTLCGFF
nr:hypothetical protein [Tanacetum cinerariifolium]